MIVTEHYFWNDKLPTGNILNEIIITDIIQFESFIKNLESYNYEFRGFNTQGVIINYKILIDDTSKLINLENKINIIENKTINLEFRLETVEEEIILLKEKINFPILEYSAEGQEITDEFFLFADLLPEHIRKELKIYKK